MDKDLQDNIILMLLSISLFVVKLPLNKSDKLFLFFVMCFPSVSILVLFYYIGFDYKMVTLGRF